MLEIGDVYVHKKYGWYIKILDIDFFATTVKVQYSSREGKNYFNEKKSYENLIRYLDKYTTKKFDGVVPSIDSFM